MRDACHQWYSVARDRVPKREESETTVKRIVRQRRLTSDEAAKYQSIREQVAAEYTTVPRFWQTSEDITESVFGNAPGLLGPCSEIRCRETKHGWRAYWICTGPLGGVASVRVVRVVGGSIVHAQDGKGEMIETLAKLAKEGLLEGASVR
jgi:hypothetical protein